jgi:hypothetical protein
MTNTLTAQRYNSGAPGLLPMMCSNTVNGATANNLTQYRYTNQAGTTLQAMPTTTTVTFIPSVAAPTATLGARVNCPSTSGVLFTWGFSLPLAAGDSGVRLCNDYTPSAANTGTFSNVLMAPLTDILIPVAAVPTETDAVFQLSELQQIFDGACVALMSYMPATAGYTLTGSLRYGWG